MFAMYVGIIKNLNKLFMKSKNSSFSLQINVLYDIFMLVMYMNNFGVVLNNYLDKYKITCKDFASYLGVSENEMKKILNGKIILNDYWIVFISLIVGIDLENVRIN